MKRNKQLLISGFLIILLIFSSIVFFLKRSETNSLLNNKADTSNSKQSLIPSVNSQNNKKIKNVFLIMMENQNWTNIKGNKNAAFINDTILKTGAFANQYYNPPGNHPSEPNYIWLEAGSNLGIKNDADPKFNHKNTLHLTNLLDQKNISWKSYQEDISGTNCPLVSAGKYGAKHNPMVFFDDVTNNNDASSQYCISHVRPYSELKTDLMNNRNIQYNFITPNICNDMHDCGVIAGDKWLSEQIPMIMASDAYKNNGVIFISFDEGEGSDGPIGMMILSPYIKSPGYSNDIHYTHSSTLKTVEEIFGITDLLGGSAGSNDLQDFFSIAL